MKNQPCGKEQHHSGCQYWANTYEKIPDFIVDALFIIGMVYVAKGGTVLIGFKKNDFGDFMSENQGKKCMAQFVD
jgi:hypothetical protein